MDFTAIENIVRGMRYVLNFIENNLQVTQSDNVFNLQLTQYDNNVNNRQLIQNDNNVLALPSSSARDPVLDIVRGTINILKYLQERGELQIYHCVIESTDDNEIDEGFYIFTANEMIQSRYQLIRLIDKGTFAKVIFAYNFVSKEYVAIKMSKKTDYCCTVFEEETFVLQFIRQCKNPEIILQMKDSFYHDGYPCIVLELLGNNLDKELRKTWNQGFDICTVRELTRSILHGLSCLKEMSVIHCDLKPMNIVIANKSKNQVKIIDYGNCCYGYQPIGACGQTLNYRAPEMILRLPFGLKIDIWSLGCIVAELFTGHRLFCGIDEPDQMAAILEVLGFPNPRIPPGISPVEKGYFRSNGYPTYLVHEDGSLKKYPEERGRLRPGDRTLNAILVKSQSKLFVHFVSQCLQWYPHKRFTPQEALNHPFMKGEL